MALKSNNYPADAAAVTPSDTVEVNYWGLYVGGTGAVVVVTENGSTVTFSAVPVGTIIPLRIKHVKATGTTATLMVGFLPTP